METLEKEKLYKERLIETLDQAFAVKLIGDSGHENQPLYSVIVTNDFNIYISNQEHGEIIVYNGLEYDQCVEGFFLSKAGEPVKLGWYKHRKQFYEIFGNDPSVGLKDLTPEEYNEIFNRAVRKQIEEFLKK